MSPDSRTCRNCGATVPAGENECPSCGRLYVDRKAARFQPGAKQERPQSSLDESISASPKDEKGDPPGSGGAETDSHYSIAPIFEEPEEEEPQEEEPYQGPPHETPSMCPCAILMIILLPLLAALLLA
ncbi:MAG: hypothetical protein GF309_09725 [Candidatus Lokiarchaeota archaeon]|nr:hypothetical protein [Candidatus Lokiarchaeota archaeon]